MVKIWFYTVLGLAMFVGGSYLAAKNVKFRFNHPKALGVVTGLIPDTNGRAESCFCQVAFTTSDGQAVTLTSRISYGKSVLPKLGSRVTVYYEPNNPNNTQIDMFLFTWLLPIGLVWGGLVCLAGAFAFWKAANKKDIPKQMDK